MPSSQTAGASIDDTAMGTRLVDSDEEDNVGMNAMQEQGKDRKLVINGIEGRVALPGFEVGFMSQNSVKESLENAVQSFRSKSVVRQFVNRDDVVLMLCGKGDFLSGEVDGG